MNATSLAAVTLAAHANAAAAAGHPLRLPSHPAFLGLRRTRFRDDRATGDVTGWFAHSADAMPIVLDDPGLEGAARLVSLRGAWLLTEEAGGLLLTATPGGDVAEPADLDAAAAELAAAVGAGAGAGVAPSAWTGTAERATAILASEGTGEELSDVAWPHFLLPASSPLPARRLAAAAATVWCWDQPGAWAGEAAERVRNALRGPVSGALRSAVAAAA